MTTPGNVCPKCGYVFGPMETTCRRCAAGFGAPASRVHAEFKPRKKSAGPVLAALLVLFAVVGGGLYLSTVGRGGMELKCKFEPGQQSSYETSMAMNVEDPTNPMMKSMDLRMSALYVEKVLTVGEDGSAEVEATMKNAQVTSTALPMLNGQSIPDQSSTYKISANGGTTSSKSDSKGGNIMQFGVPQGDGGGSSPFGGGPVLPKHRVRVGDTWNDTVPLDTGGRMEIKSRLVSDNEMVGAVKTCRIEQEFKADLTGTKEKIQNRLLGMKGDIVLTGHNVVHFSPEQGRVVDAKMKAHLKSPDNDMKMDMDIFLKLKN